MKKNRFRYEIVNEILKVVLSMSKLSSSFFNCKKTHIAFHADLTYPQLCDYLGQLIGVELLKIVRYGPYQYYEITPKIFEELQNAIDLSRKVVAITSTND